MQIVALPPCPFCGVPIGAHERHPAMQEGERPRCPSPEPAGAVCPGQWVPGEGTLLRLLKRYYGWAQPEAGMLMRAPR